MTGQMSRLPVRLVAAAAAVATGLPWPALLALTWAHTHSDGWLGAVGAARMVPYVALSWLAGAWADRMSRVRLLRASTHVRLVLLAGCALLVGTGQVAAAVVVATLAVAAGTPAYPALASVLPRLSGPDTRRVTGWLVTVEVASFFVGPAVGGLVLGAFGPTASVAVAVVGALAGSLLLLRVPVDARPRPSAGADPRGRLGTVLRIPGVTRAVTVVVVMNWAESALAVALVQIAAAHWHGGERAFGIAAAALGFGAFAAPLVGRLAHRLATLVGLAAVVTAAVAVAPAVLWAVVPLLALGATSTQIECVATVIVQDRVPDALRAFTLGATDSAMVAAALVGAAAATLVGGLGPVGFLLVVAGVLGLTGTGLIALRPSPARHRVGRTSPAESVC